MAEGASNPLDLLRLSLGEDGSVVFEISAWIVAPVVILITGIWLFRRWCSSERYELVQLDIVLGGIGKVKLKPNTEDLQVAHRIWTELTTRKAALPIDPDHDVIVEVYDSWYSLFGRVRKLVGDLPAELVRRRPGTRELVRIATDSLNLGLRPHLTRWQAEFRNWWARQDEQLKTASPQQVQRHFPDYAELMAELTEVNRELISYAGELEKLVRGR